MSKPKPPSDHHYIPKFYLKNWTLDDGRLCQFSIPHGNAVKPKRVHPTQTGWCKNLYTLSDFPEELKQQVEQDYLRLLDGRAAEANSILCSPTGLVDLSPRHRAAWTQFCLSLMTRMPEDIQAARKAIELSHQRPPEELRKSIESIDSIRSKDHPLSAEEILALLEKSDRETALFDAFMASHVGNKATSWYYSLTWHMIDFSDQPMSLLTSDRPFVRFFGSDSRSVTWALPISPSRLFIATPNRKYGFQPRDHWEIEIIKALCGSKKRLLKTMNKCVIQQAIKYVYSSDDAELQFVSKHFGKKQESDRPAQMMLASLGVRE